MSVQAMVLVAGAFLAQAGPCDLGCERRAAVALLDRNERNAAIERLRGAVARYPEDASLPLLLARAYLLDGNLFWAERTLRARPEREPSDIEARQWLAGVLIRQGDLDLAAGFLLADLDVPAGPLRSREALLEAFRARLQADSEKARGVLGRLDSKASLYAEDLAAWKVLRSQLEPLEMEALSGEIEISGGYTSNALAGSPTDPGFAGTGSFFGDGHLRARVAPRLRSVIRPVMDVDVSGHGIVQEVYRELSSLQTAVRPGVLLTLGPKRVLAGYRAEVLFLNQPVSRYSEAHRGEFELESASGWVFFAGGGRRVYRDDARTRTEWDFGLGGPLVSFARASLVFGITLRGASANSGAYDLAGASFALALRVPLSRRLALRLSGLASHDDYPSSGGLEGQRTFGTMERRTDLTAKLTAGIWLSGFKDLRVGLEGQLARRDSTADDRRGFNFDYSEGRALLVLRFAFGADPGAPRVMDPEDHIPFDWGISPGGRSETEHIIELLRQDEDLRRGSSCGL